jgi:hypothetical protein
MTKMTEIKDALMFCSSESSLCLGVSVATMFLQDINQ